MLNFEIYKMDYYTSSCGKYNSTEPFKDSIKSKKNVLIGYDEESGLYTATLNEKGGPIILSNDKKRLLEKFKDALEIMFGVSLLINMSKE